jgi:hypothetical protein
MEQWWPDQFGNPASTGTQNGLRYAFFRDQRVSVLCPHLVRTDIHQHSSLRPERFGKSGSPADASDPGVKAMVAVGMDPLEVGRRVLRGIQRNDLYILTHPEIEPILRERFEAMLGALPDEIPDPARVAVEAPTLHYWVYTAGSEGS